MSARAWLAFAAVSVLWGIPYLFIRVAVDGGMPPVFLAWSRVAIAAVVVGAMAWHAGVLPSLRGRLRWLLAYAVLEIAVPFPLIAAGERHVASSLAAIIVAAVPLIIAVLALRFEPSERVDRRRLIGLLIGFAGVLALVGIDVAGRAGELLGAAAILLAAVGYASGPMIQNRHLRELDPRAMMAAALAMAALVLTPAAALSTPARSPSAAALIAVVVLVVFCTVAAFLIYVTLVREVGPGRAAVITYVAPVLAVGLGIAVLGEHPGAGAIAGLLLILAGSWLSTDGRVPPGLGRMLARLSRRPTSAVTPEHEPTIEALRG
ncbi:MAG TPA: DMT family transporter [Solirubrobacteraceae bacterium]|nr:DMT family transporter [Solirubrobacteraceae bacterium]